MTQSRNRSALQAFRQIMPGETGAASGAGNVPGGFLGR